jgi:hypothetical protein
VTAGAGLVRDLDGYRRLEQVGATRVVTGPAARSARLTPGDAIDWAKRFADEVIAKM